MKLVVLDTESFFSREFSLKRLSTEQYVRDPQFKLHLFSMWLPDRMPDGPRDFLPTLLQHDAELRRMIETSAMLCHHAHFDGLALSHHYGLKPAFWFDTLPMARLVLPQLKSHSLESLADYFGLGGKSVPYNEFMGVRDVQGDLYVKLAEGCNRDAWLTHEIFKRLLPYVPKEELRCIDSTVRMFTEPVLRLDRPRLEQFLKDEKLRKARAMVAAGAALGLPMPTTADGMRAFLDQVETELQSSDKFKTALEALGYPCPMKWSEKATSPCEVCDGSGASDDRGACGGCAGTGKTKGGYIPALAKNDDGMKELLEHDDTRVSALAAARLGVKSTIDETRAARLLDAEVRGALPVYLSYAAAKTLRFGGGDKTNWQNFRRGGEIRKSVVAPPGHKLIVADAAQVECRGVNWMAGERWVLDIFAADGDVYSKTASDVYGRPITKADKIERFVGKTLELGCGYGLGWRKYQAQMRIGMLGGPPIILSDAEAQLRVDTYRTKHPNVVNLWSVFGKQILPMLASGGEMAFSCLEIADHKIYLPNGSALDYEGLRWGYYDPSNPQPDEQPQWWHPGRREQTKYYGGKLVENVIQALFSGLLIRQAMVKIAERYKIVLQCHDEIVIVVENAKVDEAAKYVYDVLRTPPTWAPDIPLDAETIVSERYDK